MDGGSDRAVEAGAGDAEGDAAAGPAGIVRDPSASPSTQSVVARCSRRCFSAMPPLGVGRSMPFREPGQRRNAPRRYGATHHRAPGCIAARRAGMSSGATRSAVDHASEAAAEGRATAAMRPAATGSPVRGSRTWAGPSAVRPHAALTERVSSRSSTKGPAGDGDVARGGVGKATRHAGRHGGQPMATTELVPPWSSAEVTPQSRRISAARSSAQPLPMAPGWISTPGRSHWTEQASGFSRT